MSLGSGTDTKVGIALHINPRWDDGKPVVVRNSYLKNKWGSEERWGDFFPLTAGQNFECIILVQSDCFKVNATIEIFFHALSRDPDEESLNKGDVAKTNEKAGVSCNFSLINCINKDVTIVNLSESTLYQHNDAFTLTETDTKRETDKMANDISVPVQYEHLHSIPYKPFLSVLVSVLSV